MTDEPNYFLIAVSTRENLDLCIRHGLAGFPSSRNGLWTFTDIAEGDMVSFLYGARVHNLYRVKRKYAILDAQAAPPWKPLVFQESGKTYVFNYRLDLDLVRELSESVVRAEFAYVAENLLLRAGYAKTHFQADRTTLQCVSRLGQVAGEQDEVVRPAGDWPTYRPRFAFKQREVADSTQAYFSELILQAAIRARLREPGRAAALLDRLKLDQPPTGQLEVLGEKALSRGHVDVLIKEAVSVGISRCIAIEVKRNVAEVKDVEQTARYRDELGAECAGVILAAPKFRRAAVVAAEEAGVALVHWTLPMFETAPHFDEIVAELRFEMAHSLRGKS